MLQRHRGPATALPYMRQNATLFVAAVELRILLIAIHISLIGFRQIYNSVALPYRYGVFSACALQNRCMSR